MVRPRVRNQLLKAARYLYESEGASALTTRRVAEQAGVTEASVFNNFTDKAGLLAALISEALPQQSLLMTSILADITFLHKWLEEVFIRAIDFYQLVLPFTAMKLSPSGIEKKERFSKPQSALKLRFDYLQQEGSYPASLDTEMASRLLMGLSLHTAMMGLALGESSDNAYSGEQLVKVLGIHG